VIGRRNEYRVIHPDGRVATGTFLHRVDRSPAHWTLDDLHGLVSRLRDFASGDILEADEEIFCEMSATPGIGTLIMIGGRGTTASVQLREPLSADLVHQWYAQQPGVTWTSRSDPGTPPD
jgi:hypothetical protein